MMNCTAIDFTEDTVLNVNRLSRLLFVILIKKPMSNHPRSVAMFLITFSSVYFLFGCDVCSTPGEVWCDGQEIKQCTVDDEDYWDRNAHVSTVTTCSSGFTCRQWTVFPNSHDARCIPNNVCDDSKVFCEDKETVATCFDNEKFPRFNHCGDENFEGRGCNENEKGASCVFSSAFCDIDGLESCFHDSRYYSVCSQGRWAILDSCPVGETCVQVSDSGVDCMLRTK